MLRVPLSENSMPIRDIEILYRVRPIESYVGLCSYVEAASLMIANPSLYHL